MIHQLNPTIDVSTPLGDGEAMFIVDYGVNVNTVWVVRLDGGVMKHFYSDDVRVYGNPMNGKGWDTENLKPSNDKKESWDDVFDYIRSEIHEDIPHRVRHFISNTFTKPIRRKTNGEVNN